MPLPEITPQNVTVEFRPVFSVRHGGSRKSYKVYAFTVTREDGKRSVDVAVDATALKAPGYDSAARAAREMGARLLRADARQLAKASSSRMGLRDFKRFAELQIALDRAGTDALQAAAIHEYEAVPVAELQKLADAAHMLNQFVSGFR